MFKQYHGFSRAGAATLGVRPAVTDHLVGIGIPLVIEAYSGLAGAIQAGTVRPLARGEVYYVGQTIAMVVAVRPVEAIRAPSRRGPPTRVCGVR